MNAKPTIFRYNDYRQYLADWLTWRKSRGSYSLRQFSKTAGYSSPNILQDVLQGRRNLGVRGAQKFSSGLGLSDDERQFFETLVQMAHAVTPGERLRLYQRLLRHPERRKVVPLETEKLQVFRYWLSPVIYEMIDFPDFEANPVWIAAQFAQEVSVAEVRRALADLVATDMVAYDEDGALRKKIQDPLTSSENVAHDDVFRYHETALMKTADALFTVEPEARTFNVLTVAGPRRSFEKLRRRFEQLEADVLAMLESENDPKDEVFQICWYAFPILQRPSNRKK